MRTVHGVNIGHEGPMLKPKGVKTKIIPPSPPFELGWREGKGGVHSEPITDQVKPDARAVCFVLK